jgi:hypothetical protein
MAFDRSSLRWLGIGTSLPNPEGPPSSLVQLRIAGTHGDARETANADLIRSGLFKAQCRNRIEPRSLLRRAVDAR